MKLSDISLEHNGKTLVFEQSVTLSLLTIQGIRSCVKPLVEEVLEVGSHRFDLYYIGDGFRLISKTQNVGGHISIMLKEEVEQMEWMETPHWN